jgi:transposase-like protein
MRLQLILPRVNPAKMTVPATCPYEGCQGRHFGLWQEVDKALRDTVYPRVKVQRYECLRCKRTFRVYPQGVTRAQSSQRVHGLAVMLYVLGLSYGAVSLALEGLGVYVCKTRVYEVVQAAAERVPGLKREQVFEGIQTPALGGDLTSVKCKGRWLPLGLTVDDTTGIVLTLDAMPGEDAETLQDWLKPIAAAVGAQLLVTDDADGFKTVADELALEHQVCKGHVKRNTETLIENWTPLVARDSDGSLQAIGVVPEQAIADLERLGELILSRQPEEEAELETMHRRYLEARPPRKGEQASMAYRLRLLFLDRWTLWPRLTCYRTWQGPQGQTVDGTNNGSERAIGWWIKERYRTMRGYKRPKSAVNVSRLLAWAGNHLGSGGAELATLIS